MLRLFSALFPQSAVHYSFLSPVPSLTGSLIRLDLKIRTAVELQNLPEAGKLSSLSYTKANKEFLRSFFPAFFAYEVNGFAG